MEFMSFIVIYLSFSSWFLQGSKQSIMDSRPRRLPFCPSSSSYTPSPAVSSSSLGSSRLYSRETVLNNDRFPRASTPYKSDLSKQVGRWHSTVATYSFIHSTHLHCKKKTKQICTVGCIIAYLECTLRLIVLPLIQFVYAVTIHGD